jgi:hypothetical protein
VLTLSGPAKRAANQELSLDLAFENQGPTPLVVVRPLDGSLEYFRAPMVDVYAREEASGKVYRFAYTGGRCGNVNPIQEDDYATLAPRESRSDVTDNGWAGYLKSTSLPRAGRYAVWVVYTFCDFINRGSPLAADVIRSEAYLGAHASNALQVEVR